MSDRERWSKTAACAASSSAGSWLLQATEDSVPPIPVTGSAPPGATADPRDLASPHKKTVGAAMVLHFCLPWTNAIAGCPGKKRLHRQALERNRERFRSIFSERHQVRELISARCL